MRAVREDDIWTRLGVTKQEDLFFKIHPELIGTVTEVRMDKTECPSCKEPSREAWVYRQSGDWLQENVWPICNDCQKDTYATQVTKQIRDKHQNVIDGDWYFISDDDQAGFKNYEPFNEPTTAAKTKAIDYAKSLISGEVRNMRLSGTPGTGKTHLAKAIARTLKHEGKRVAFIEAAELFEKIKRTFGNDVERKRLDDHFAGFELVVIDDVGLETKKVSDVSWTSTEWPKLIDLRKGKSTVYTTNFDEAALANVIGARAESRMSENAESVEIFTPDKDYRKLKNDGSLFY